MTPANLTACACSAYNALLCEKRRSRGLRCLATMEAPASAPSKSFATKEAAEAAANGKPVAMRCGLTGSYRAWIVVEGRKAVAA